MDHVRDLLLLGLDFNKSAFVPDKTILLDLFDVVFGYSSAVQEDISVIIFLTFESFVHVFNHRDFMILDGMHIINEFVSMLNIFGFLLSLFLLFLELDDSSLQLSLLVLHQFQVIVRLHHICLGGRAEGT